MSKKKPRDLHRFRKSGVGDVMDTSDIDMKHLVKYTSATLEKMKENGLYEDLLETIGALSFANKSKYDIINKIRERFPLYCGNLTEYTFDKWVANYGDIAKAYSTNRELNLGTLVYWGMKKAKRSIDVDHDDFILKLMDRLDDGTINPKNGVISNKSSLRDDGMSKQTKGTLDRIFNEVSRFGGLDNIKIDDSEYEEDDL